MSPVTPEEVGLSSIRLNRIRTHMQHYVDRRELAGLVTVVARHGKVAYAECFGMMDIEANKPMQFDTIFGIVSMTKPITSVATMMLYEEGHFLLSDPVSKFIPEFKSIKVLKKTDRKGMELADTEREITIRDLLTHTSGISGEIFPEGDLVDATYQKVKVIDLSGTLKDMVAKLVRLPLAFNPGSEWRYGLSTDVLGYLVEVISGVPFDVFLHKRIFEPLGMRDTGFYVPPKKLDRLAAVYGPAVNGVKVIEVPSVSRYSTQPTFLSGGRGLVSTASDYLRFCQMLLNKGELDRIRLLGRKTVELMTENHLPDRLIPFRVGNLWEYRGHGFGLGFAVIVDVAQSEILGSRGLYFWGGSLNTSFWVDPKEEMIGILMTHFAQPFHPVGWEFRALAYQAIAD